MTHGFRIHAYCVMPDHLHLLAEGSEDSSDLLAFIGRFKHQTAHNWAKRSGFILWQKKFYDHILRRTTSCDAVAWYIWMNPVRKALCCQPDEYPYSGSFTVNWKRAARPTEAWLPFWKRTVPG